LIAAGALLGAPLVRAQTPGRTYRVGALFPFSPLSGQPYVAALRERLATHGFVDGRNLAIEPRFPFTNRFLAADQVREMIAQKADAIFALTTVLTQGAQAATRSVPIVFAWVADPVVSGILKEYRKPGGNTTGVTNRFFELTGKRMELVRELLAAAKRVVVLSGIIDETLQTALRLAQPTVERLGLELIRLQAGFDWPGAVQTASRSGADAVLIMSPFSLFGLASEAQQVVRQAMELRIPTIYSDAEPVEMGGLVSYATNPVEDLRRGAEYLARVLKGESPATLPVDQASRLELVLNLKTARALGLTIPQSIAVRADRVIE
jgi:putative ABC transport system substrate-binding protein